MHWNCSRNLSKRFSIKYLAAVHIFCTFEHDKYKCVFLITVSMGTLKILSCGYNLVTERKLESINCYDTRSWEKGSFSSLSANKGVNQRVAWFTPFITPKNFIVLENLSHFFITIFVCIRESNNYHTYKYDLRIYQS